MCTAELLHYPYSKEDPHCPMRSCCLWHQYQCITLHNAVRLNEVSHVCVLTRRYLQRVHQNLLQVVQQIEDAPAVAVTIEELPIS